MLQKLSSDHKGKEQLDDIDAILIQLQKLRWKASKAKSLDSLRGYEGIGASLYFRGLSRFFPDTMPFTRRSRRPPRDAANALLSWTYTMVNVELKSALTVAGLDPCIGALHTVGYGRPSLALDLLEPLRPALCDLFVLRLAKLRIITEADFQKNEDEGGVTLRSEAMKKFFVHYEKRMQRPFKQAGTGRPTTFRQYVRDTALDYTKALRQGIAVKPFLMA